MKWTMRHDREPPPRSALAGSLLVHGAVGALVLLLSLSRPESIEFESFEIELVSPPASQVAEVIEAAVQPEELEVETPDPDPLPEPPPLPDPAGEPVETPPDSVETPPEPEEEPVETTPPTDSTEAEVRPATTTDSTAEESSETGQDIAVRMEGLRRDYPVYYNNIVTQIARCFRPPNSNRRDLRTVVQFVILPDGTVSGLGFVERSGNSEFDFRALSAIGDCAGTGRFGPLPEDFPWERLPIQFEFRPRGDAAPATPAVP